MTKIIKNNYGFLEYMHVLGVIDIINIEVDEKYRRQGFAQALLDELFKLCASEIFLEVRTSNLPAISLYEKNGFKVISKRLNYYKNPSEDALVMVLNL